MEECANCGDPFVMDVSGYSCDYCGHGFCIDCYADHVEEHMREEQY